MFEESSVVRRGERVGCVLCAGRDGAVEEVADRNCGACQRLGGAPVCYVPWLRLQNLVFRLVTHAAFDWLITLCIVANVLVMALVWDQQARHATLMLLLLSY